MQIRLIQIADSRIVIDGGPLDIASDLRRAEQLWQVDRQQLCRYHVAHETQTSRSLAVSVPCLFGGYGSGADCREASDDIHRCRLTP